MALLYRVVLFVIYAALIAPLLVVVLVSFGPSPTFEFPPSGVSLRWFELFLSKDDMVEALVDVSLLVATATAALAIAIGVPAAVALSRLEFPGRRLLYALVNMPLLVPQVLLGVSLLLVLITLGWRPNAVWLVLAHVTITVPFVVNTVLAALAKVDPALEEAAMNLGCSRPTAFLRVTLPVIRSGVLNGAIMAFIISFGDINLALFLTGPGVTTIPVYTFSSLMFQAEPDIAAVSSVQIFIVAALLVFLAKTVGLGRS
jgi:putative spermidine/putrescine transport system permease protein